VPCGVWRAPDARVGDGDRLDFLIAILTLALVGVVVLVVGAPVRRGQRAGESAGGAGAAQPVGAGQVPALDQPEDLESAREAKYREIRDTELDYRTGKLSREDYDAIDADLRAEAIDILNRLKPTDPTDPQEPEDGSRGLSGARDAGDASPP